MNNWKIILFVLFGLVLFIDCFLIIKNLNQYRVFTKTLLVPVMLLAIFIESQNTKHKRSRILVNIAFLFCFIGDLFLLTDSHPKNFIFGLCSFLLAHLFFSFFFYRLKPFSSKYRVFIFSVALAILGYVLALLFLLRRIVSRQSLEIPVSVYTIMLGFMLLTAINSSNNRSIKKIATTYFIPGALLFVLSDSILAINKFYVELAYSGVMIMISYAAALFLFANGITRFMKK